jgi:hypothetical protein
MRKEIWKDVIQVCGALWITMTFGIWIGQQFMIYHPEDLSMSVTMLFLGDLLVCSLLLLILLLAFGFGEFIGSIIRSVVGAARNHRNHKPTKPS